MSESKTSEKGTWSASIFVDCPYCGKQQDLVDCDGDPRLPNNLTLGEHRTDKTTNFETWCVDCDEHFIVPDLEW